MPPPTTPLTTPVAETRTSAAPNPGTPTPVPVPASAPLRVQVTDVSAQFAPSVDQCSIRYTITGAATSVRIQVFSGTSTTVVATINNAPHGATNEARWDGRLTSGGWALPLGYTIKVTATGASGSVDAEPRRTKVEVHSVVVTGNGPTSAHPDRIYRPAAGGADAEPVELTARVKLRSASGAGVETEVPVRVEWRFDAAAGNCRDAGSKGATATYWQAATGFTSTVSGATAQGDAATSGGNKGLHKIRFLGTTVGGDSFTPIARVSNGAGMTPASVEGRRERPLEVWRKITFNGTYRTSGGLDVAGICAGRNLQSILDGVFIEYTLGTVNPIARSGEYLAQLTAPAQRPATGTVSAVSEAGDTRRVQIDGRVQTATGTEDHTERLTLNGATAVQGTATWQAVLMVQVIGAGAQAVRVTSSGGSSGTLSADSPALFNISWTFETAASATAKAQAWHNANKTAWDAALAGLRPAGVSGHILVGTRLLHPKRHGDQRTTYFEGFPDIRINVEGGRAHPDEIWHSIDAAALADGTSVLFSNLEGSTAYKRLVACHEVAHSTLAGLRGNRTFGGGDHCSDPTCIMETNAMQANWCTTQSTLQRMKGWHV